MTHEHNPAFPVSLPGMGDNGASGLTQRAYAAIALKVPDSGEAWLDDMIRASRQMDLREQVMARKADDIRPLAAPDVPEEVSPLIKSFNELLQRVENEGAAQKRFIANAAHQLRTPLAGIRMQTELALRVEGAGDGFVMTGSSSP